MFIRCCLFTAIEGVCDRCCWADCILPSLLYC